MRKMAIAVALASTAIATPALARNDAWYIGVEGGAMLVEDINFDLSGTSTTVIKTDARTGYDVDGIIGYDFGPFRMEAEVGYKSADANQHTLSVPLGGAAAGVYPRSKGAKGTASALSFMLNGLLDFGDDDGINGFVGGGVGVARVKFSDFGVGSLTLLDDSDTGFAYQAIAGIRAPLTDNIDVGLKYRFFNADNIDLIAKTGNAVETRFRSHSLLGSFIFNFGEKAEPMAPPPAPPAPEPAPPPPPPAAAVCSPGPYIVFFEWDKSDITPEAGSILDNAVTAYGDCGQAQVMLAGHADKSGTPKYNLGLSQRRNDAVQSYLTGKGIPGGVITTKAFGEGAPRVETADGVRELQNRRVEIQYGPGSGM
jgi:OmpA-OmpF porin, OOP family